MKSVWSKAGVGTSIVLDTDTADTGGRASRIVFDIGATPSIADAFPASTVIISHGHVDHIGGIFNHARAHSLAYFSGTTPTYYVPAALVETLEEARRAMSSLDAFNDGSEGSRSESLIKMDIVGVNAGDEIELKLKKIPGGKKLYVRAFAVDHCGHPALGYVIVSRHGPGLKPEYQGLRGDQLCDLVKSGVQIKGDPVEAIEVAYTGDTSVDGIMKRACDGESCSKSDMYLNQAFQASLILCEATYLEPQLQETAKSRGHVCINDISAALSSHCWDGAANGVSRKIILLHVSARHKPVQKALRLMANHLPGHIREHCDVAVSSLLTEKERRERKYLVDLMKPNGCISLKEYTSIQGVTSTAY